MRTLKGTLLTPKMKHNIEYTEKINNILKKEKHAPTLQLSPELITISICPLCHRRITVKSARSYYKFPNKKVKLCHDSCGQTKGLEGKPGYRSRKKKKSVKRL